SSSSYGFEACGMIFPTPPSLLDSEFADLWIILSHFEREKVRVLESEEEKKKRRRGDQGDSSRSSWIFVGGDPYQVVVDVVSCVVEVIVGCGT
ncbi:hypothetical protein MTR67_007749, partial [Solanum verrucosum]